MKVSFRSFICTFLCNFFMIFYPQSFVLNFSFLELLWRAPEILRDQLSCCSKGTQKGDVYSFGIILYEILGRCGPWGNMNLSPSEIIKRVITRTFGMEPFRPNLDVISSQVEQTENNRCCGGNEDTSGNNQGFLPSSYAVCVGGKSG